MFAVQQVLTIFLLAIVQKSLLEFLAYHRRGEIPVCYNHLMMQWAVVYSRLIISKIICYQCRNHRVWEWMAGCWILLLFRHQLWHCQLTPINSPVWPSIVQGIFYQQLPPRLTTYYRIHKFAKLNFSSVHVDLLLLAVQKQAKTSYHALCILTFLSKIIIQTIMFIVLSLREFTRVTQPMTLVELVTHQTPTFRQPVTYPIITVRYFYPTWSLVLISPAHIV